MDESGRCGEGDRNAALTGGETERQRDNAGAAVAESNNIIAGDGILAAREFENEWLVQRWDSGEVERVETLHRRKTGHADAPLDHAPFAIDEFELGEAQKEAGMIEPLARGSAATFSYSRR
jgi:hypothetical protein